MNPVEEMLRNYKEIRARLRNPPNAVPDTGINLRPIKAIPPEEAPPEPSLPQAKKPPLQLLRGLTFSSTLQITAEEFGITQQDIRTKRRMKAISFPRQVAVYIATDRHHRSLSWVSRQLGMDHSTIIHGRNKVRDLVSSDPEFRDRVDSLENRIALFAAASLSPHREPHLETQPERDVSRTPIPKVDC